MDIRSLDLPVHLPSGDECLRCIGRLQEGLPRIKGVVDASVNNAHDTLHIAYDPNLVTFSRIESEARRLGAEITASVDHATLLLEGLDNPDAAQGIERAIGALDGILWAGVSFTSAQMHVEFRPDQIRLPEIIRRIAGQGVQAVPLDRAPAAATPSVAPQAAGRAPTDTGRQAFFLRRAGMVAASAFLAVVALVLQWAEGPGAHSVSPFIWAAALIVGGARILRGAVGALIARAVDMNVLLTLAVIGAAALGSWGEAAAVVLLYDVGVLLQARALERTRRSIRTLMDLTPPTARVRRNGLEQTLPVSEVRVGDTVLIRPGERIPMDGEILQGAGSVNEAPITGESVPVEKRAGDNVYAGTLNGQAALDVRVSRPYDDTVLAQVVHGVEEAQSQRAPAEQFLDRFARRYTPIVFWLAVAVAIVPPLLLGGDFSWYFPTWLHRGLSLLLIACPFGLILATPVAITAALGTAARRGVLIKGGAYLENVGAVRAMVYDKTGTLTEGVLQVADVVPFGEMTCAEILSHAALMESHSEHPVAQAIVMAAERQRPAVPLRITEVVEMPGRGLRGPINDTLYLLGSPALFAQAKVSLTPEAEQALEEAEAAGVTCVLLGKMREVQGLILLRDRPRPEAKAAIAALRRQGILYQAMLTGDNVRVAAHVAAAAGLEEYQGGLLPEKKLQHIRHLQHRYGRVAMVGDGINDAPALAAADIGIAMGVAGSDIALAASDIALMRDDLSRLPFLIHLSRSTRSIVRQNVAIALLTKAALLGSAVLATLPLWLVILGDVGVALLVTINAFRLVDGPDVDAPPAPAIETDAEGEPLLDLVFINDKSVDEQPEAGFVYPKWERFVISFTGTPIRFGRKSEGSILPVQIDDSGMSRLHGEIRLEGGRPVVVDLQSTNGIRFNGRTQGALVPPLRPTPLRFGDNLLLGRNTRVEIRRPGEFGVGKRVTGAGGRAVVENGAEAQPMHAEEGSSTQDLHGKSGVPTG